MFSTSNFAKIFLTEFKNQINFVKIKKIITPYEGQPFQNHLFNYIKNLNKNVKTFGYLHYAHPLQFDVIFRDGSPDYLLTHSLDQKNYLIKKLGWPNKKVKLIESLRYLKKDNKRNYENKIFLPYFLDERKKYIQHFDYFLKKSKKNSLPKFKIKPHPAAHNNHLQKNLLLN